MPGKNVLLCREQGQSGTSTKKPMTAHVAECSHREHGGKGNLALLFPVTVSSGTTQVLLAVRPSAGEPAVTSIRLSLRRACPQRPTECAAQTLKTVLKNNPLRNKKALYQPAMPGPWTAQVMCGTWVHSPQKPVGCIFIPNSQAANTSRNIHKACSRQTQH